VVLVLAVSLFARTGNAASAPDAGLRPLHATHGAGARIVDDLGRTVILRGVNVNGLGEYYQEWPDLPSTLPLTDADFAEIAADGFNVVRLLITWSRLEPSPGAIDTAYLDRIEETVAMAKAHDVYVLLDMHQDAWGPHVDTPDGVMCPPGLTPAVGWDGAPEWATALVGTPLTCTIGGTRELSASAETSFTQFYADLDGVQQHLIDVWTAVAQRFANEPAVAGYDLLNEPNPGMVPGVTDYTLLGLFYGRVIAAIRSVDTAHTIFFEPAVITGPLAVPAPLPVFSNDTNLVYAPHLYNESISILPGTIEDGFANAATAAARYGTPFFSGEWGWFGEGAVDQPFIERYASNEDARMVGGTWWQWKQACGDPHAIGTRGHRPSCAGKSIYSDGLITRAQENVDVLTRAYPRAAPGVLASINAQVATGSVRVTGVADAADVRADLWVPARCGSPIAVGTNIGPSTTADVPGGSRVTVPVVAASAYEITIVCAQSVTSGAIGTTPATGGDDSGALVAAAIVAFALGVRRVRSVRRRRSGARHRPSDRYRWPARC